MDATLDSSAYAGTVGFIGLGAMGGPIVRHLLNQGYSILVSDLNQEALETARQAGAQVAANPSVVAEKAELIFLCLPSLGAIRSVLLGSDGIVSKGTGRVVIDLSTTGPAFAREMNAALQNQGIAYLDAPITGNVKTAGSGKLGLMCSGKQQAFELARPVLETMAGAIVLYLGSDAGRAQTLKLLNNLNSASGMAVSCEAFVIGTKLGLDPQAMLQIINAGDASTNASRNKFPASILPRSFDYGARMEITAKDITLTVEEADRLHVPAWIARPVQQLWRYAISQGGGERDGSSLITYLEPWARTEVKASGAQQDVQLTAPSTPLVSQCQILCEAEHGPQLLQALEQADLTVSLSDDADGAPRSQCVVRIMPGDTDWPAVLDNIPQELKYSHPLIINACWLPRSQAHSLAQRVLASGMKFVDAPAASRPEDMLTGAGSVIASGKRDDVTAALPVLQALGERVYLISENAGDAQLMRQIDEAVSATLLAVACEAYVVGARAGISPDNMHEILKIETGRTHATATLFPQQIVNRKFSDGKKLSAALRALTLVCDEASRIGFSPWILESARLLYTVVASQIGRTADITRIAAVYEQWAGVDISKVNS